MEREFPDRKEFSRLTRGQTGFGKFQHCLNLLSLDTRKPFEKIIDCRSRFEILEQRAYRNACVFENPRAADFAGISFHDGAIFPVEHDKTIRQQRFGSKVTDST